MEMTAYVAAVVSLFWWSLLKTCVAESDVLDPSLYLLPSPPLVAQGDPGSQWSQQTRVTRDAGIQDIETRPTTTPEPDSMDSAETFWPSFRAPYGLGGIHIPLTFSVSGTYGGGYHGYGSGVVGSSYGSSIGSVASSYGSLSAEPATYGRYASQTADSYGKSALAGSSYGNYGSAYPGVRVHGNGGKTGWSGWGNGKWGHYGKG